VTALTALCANIRNARLARGWSQESTAEKAGLSVRHFQDIEAGRRAGVRLETVEKIGKTLHVQTWELLQPGRFPESTHQRGKSVRRIKR
jgi:transcriptional regulator with XRE-family HTH domain